MVGPGPGLEIEKMGSPLARRSGDEIGALGLCKHDNRSSPSSSAYSPCNCVPARRNLSFYPTPGAPRRGSVASASVVNIRTLHAVSVGLGLLVLRSSQQIRGKGRNPGEQPHACRRGPA